MGLADEVTDSIKVYFEKVKDLTNAELEEIQKEMLLDVIDLSPFDNDNVYKPGTRYRTGIHMKNGWKTDKLNFEKNKRVYVVRNVIKPRFVHLVAFSHRHFSHREPTGIFTRPNSFIRVAERNANQKIRERLEEKINNG